jgi:hypothetical protein
MNRTAEAIGCFERALAIGPADPRTQWHLAMNHLLSGNFAAGWDRLEARFEATGACAQEPAWDGAPFQPGTRVLLRAEQGHGDTLQFVRYAPLLAARGAVVLLEVQPGLKRLLAAQPWGHGVIAQGDALPPHELQCPLMSLPRAFATRLATIPAEIPYLRADPREVAAWRHRLAPMPGPRVGLAWAGGFRPQDLEVRMMDRRRSMPLARLAPLARVPGVRLVSLQKGPPSAQARHPPADMALLDWTDELRDFADTAALIEALDLVISVDTAVAHLAGALGRPVWLLNRFDTDWRWLLARDDSPWYPTMRLFRQPSPGDWDGVVRSVADALAASYFAATRQA